jgi:hypothetical protein
MNAWTGNIGQGCVNLDSLWATSTKFLRQFKTGIVSSFESYKATYTSTKKEQPFLDPSFCHFTVVSSMFLYVPE